MPGSDTRLRAGAPPRGSDAPRSRAASPGRKRQAEGAAAAFARAILEAASHDDVAGDHGDAGTNGVRTLLRLNKLALMLPIADLDSRPRDAGGALARWRDTYQLRTMELNAASIRTTGAVHDAFEREEIGHVFFKGPPQHVALHDNAFIRPSGDVDVLVRSRDFAAAERVLHGLGFESDAGQRLWWRRFLGEQHFTSADPMASTIDLHHKLQQPGSPDGLDAEDAIARAVRVEVAGRSFPLIDACDTVIVAAQSVAKGLMHREAVGGYLFDYHVARRSLSEAQAAELDARIRKGRLAGTVAVADALLAALAMDAVPPGPLDRFDMQTLRHFALAPNLASLPWPRRRELVMLFCDRNFLHFIEESVLLAVSELVRASSERTRPWGWPSWGGPAGDKPSRGNPA